jgi:hypothetical protein
MEVTSSGMWRRVVSEKLTDFSEERTISILIWLHLQTEDGGSAFLQIVVKFLPESTVSHQIIYEIWGFRGGHHEDTIFCITL